MPVEGGVREVGRRGDPDQLEACVEPLRAGGQRANGHCAAQAACVLPKDAVELLRSVAAMLPPPPVLAQRRRLLLLLEDLGRVHSDVQPRLASQHLAVLLEVEESVSLRVVKERLWRSG